MRVTGIGVGLREPFWKGLLAQASSDVAFLEIHPENYVRHGGRNRRMLATSRERWPVVTHGLTACVGSTRPFAREWTDALRDFLAGIDAPWHSEHLCWGDADGGFLHELLPIPFTRAAARTCARRVRELRDAIERPVAVENITYSAVPDGRAEDELDVLLDVLEESGAGLLLDVNNVYVNSRNHGFDPYAWIDRIPMDRVWQIHVAGHDVEPDGLRIDTHGAPVCEDVHALLEYTLRRTGPVAVLLERDGSWPPFEELAVELRTLRAIYERTVPARAEAA